MVREGEKSGVALQLTANAITVLRRRYLAKDLEGNLVESPEDMFRRVARNVMLIDVLYHPAVFQRDGGQQHPCADGPRPVAAGHYTAHDVETLLRAHRVLNRAGCMKHPPESLIGALSGQAGGDPALLEAVSAAQASEEEVLQALTALEFMLNSPTLMNAGRELQQLAACFVLPVDDSLDGIFESVKHAALIQKSGGGTGFTFSHLRPKNDIVRTTGGVASGPVSFMKVFNSATEAVIQGGTRRGANMGVLRVDHPDILEFITCKQNEKDITNFNISVGLTRPFMEALAKGDEYDLVNPRTGEVVRRLSAAETFNLIVEMAWKNGEPGVLFLERLEEDNPTPALGVIESTNPCGEQPLLPYEACNLGSVNCALMVDADRREVDWARLRRVVHLGVHCLDNAIDANCYPIDRIAEMSLGNRKIGLGVMGFAEMLIRLGIPYDSEAALRIADELMGFIDRESKAASAALAEKRGPFLNFRGSAYDRPGGKLMRNATTTTVAPTGTISMICGTTSGIEPLYAIAFVRRVLDNQRLVESNLLFEAAAHKAGIWSEELMRRVAARGSVRGMPGVPADLQQVFVTAHDVTPEWHVRMQAAFQRHTDNAVSKTVNFPNEATVAEVAHVYRLACELGCKGVTVYRDKSRAAQVLSFQEVAPVADHDAEPVKETEDGRGDGGAQAGMEDALAGGGAAAREGAPDRRSDGDDPAAGAPPWHKLAPRVRPPITVGRTERISTGCGKLYVTINEDEFGPCEVFTQMGKSGGCPASQSEAVSRLVSLALRAGIQPRAITKHLRGIRCLAPSWENGGQVLSCPDAIGIVMERYLRWKETGQEDSQPLSAGREVLDQQVGACPECGSHVKHQDGCITCLYCGFSRCS